MSLSRIWRIRQIKEVDKILRDLYYSFKIIPSLKTRQNMLNTFVDVKFTSVMAVQKIKSCSGLQTYSSQQILSIELQETISRRQTSKMFRHFCFHSQNNSTLSPGLLSSRCLNLQEHCTFDVIYSLNEKFFQIQSSVAGYGELHVLLANQNRGNILNE